MGNILKMAELVINKGVNALDMAKLTFYLFPSLFSLTVPMATMICIAIGFARLSSDFEITAMKASGISLHQMLPPVIVLATATWLITFFLTIYGAPWGTRSFKTLLFEIARNKASVAIKERVFIDDFEGYVLYVNKVSVQGDEMKGVLISEKKTTGKSTTIIAKRGYILPNDRDRTLSLLLKDGTIYQPNPKKNSLHAGRFDTNIINLDITGKDRGKRDNIKNSELTIRQLLDKIESCKDQPRRYYTALVEFHKKFSSPVSCIIFGLIGLPLGLQIRPRGKSHGFILGLGVILTYYIIFSFAEALGKGGKVPVVPAIWFPNMLVGLLGIYFFLTTAKEKQIPFIEWAETLIDHIVRLVGKLLNPNRDNP
jgi:lipopolysaccharide export system permease protein